MATLGYEYSFSVFGLDLAEADALHMRMADLICGGDHGTNETCPSGLDWVSSMCPIVADDEPIDTTATEREPAAPAGQAMNDPPPGYCGMHWAISLAGFAVGLAAGAAVIALIVVVTA